ncbi:MAG: hypothetical protein JO076_12590 [Verrucomicrobia bacterium]|nr:hypothetical protein [Verrucomicrobiota bacterium]
MNRVQSEVKWIASGGVQGLGAVLANATPMPDGLGSYQEFLNGTIFYSPDFGEARILTVSLIKIASIA